MKLFKLFLSLTMTTLLVSCSSPKASTSASASTSAVPATVTITDHADREVEVPTNPKRVAVLGIYPLPSMLTVYLDSCDSIVAMEPGSMNAAKNGMDLANIEGKADTAQGLADSAATNYLNLVGVNLDEELSDMIRYQRAYEASAKLFSR